MKIIKSLKKIGASVLATGVTLTMAACYGVYDSTSYVPRGEAIDSVTGAKIPGLRVCAVQHEFEGCTFTDFSGQYDLWDNVQENIKFEDYEVCITDVDGAENGSYEAQCKPVEAYTEDPEINFSLTNTEK